MPHVCKSRVFRAALFGRRLLATGGGLLLCLALGCGASEYESRLNRYPRGAPANNQAAPANAGQNGQNPNNAAK